LAALEEEIRGVADRLRPVTKTRWGKRVIHSGELGEKRVVVMASGIGKVRAAIAAQYLIDRHSVDRMILTGFAGALHPALSIGDILVCRRAVAHDSLTPLPGVSRRPGIPWIQSDPGLRRLALRAAHRLGWRNRVGSGTVLTGDRPVLDGHEKERLYREFRGDCVDMEGAAVALACSRNRIPLLIIRTISDLADERALDDFRSSAGRLAADGTQLILALLAEAGENERRFSGPRRAGK